MLFIWRACIRMPKVYMGNIVLMLMNPHTYYYLVTYSRKYEKVLP